MKVDLEYQSALDFFNKEIDDVKEKMFEQRKKIINKSAKVVKAAIVKNLTRSSLQDPLYAHMQDDVKIKVKDDNEGEIVAIIHGGKKTGYKWHMLDDGTSTTKATHFTEKSLKETEGDLEAIMSQAIWEAIQ